LKWLLSASSMSFAAFPTRARQPFSLQRVSWAAVIIPLSISRAVVWSSPSASRVTKLHRPLIQAVRIKARPVFAEQALPASCVPCMTRSKPRIGCGVAGRSPPPWCFADVGPGTAGDPSGGGRAALDRHRDFLKIDPECIVEQEGGAFERRKPLTAVLNKWRDRVIHR